MCIRIRAILGIISDDGEFMTKSEVKKIIDACASDMESQAKEIFSMRKEIDIMKKDINDVKLDMKEVRTTQNLILEQVKNISMKLNDSQIEEKAFAYERNQEMLHNWKVICGIILVIALAGVGFYNLLDKQAGNIQTIVKSVK